MQKLKIVVIWRFCVFVSFFTHSSEFFVETRLTWLRTRVSILGLCNEEKLWDSIFHFAEKLNHCSCVDLQHTKNKTLSYFFIQQHQVKHLNAQLNETHFNQKVNTYGYTTWKTPISHEIKTFGFFWSFWPNISWIFVETCSTCLYFHKLVLANEHAIILGFNFFVLLPTEKSRQVCHLGHQKNEIHKNVFTNTRPAQACGCTNKSNVFQRKIMKCWLVNLKKSIIVEFQQFWVSASFFAYTLQLFVEHVSFVCTHLCVVHTCVYLWVT